MPDFAELLRELRRQAPDATRVRPSRPDVSRMVIPTVGPTGAQMPRGRQATIADRAVGMLRGAGEPMGDTPLGMVNEVVNPVRAGVQAREMVGATMAQGRRAMRTGGVGDAAVTAALGGMTLASMVPGMPRLTAAQKAVMKELEVGGYVKQFGNGATLHAANGDVVRQMRYDVWERLQDAVPELKRPRDSMSMGGSGAAGGQQYAQLFGLPPKPQP